MKRLLALLILTSTLLSLLSCSAKLEAVPAETAVETKTEEKAADLPSRKVTEVRQCATSLQNAE